MIIKALKPGEKKVPDIWDKRLETLKTYTGNKLLVSTTNFIHIIDIQKIIYIKSLSNYSEITLNDNQKILTSKTLKHFENRLIEKSFLRVHNSYLINLSKVKGIIKNGIYTLLLEEDVKIPVTRSYKNRLFSTLINY